MIFENLSEMKNETLLTSQTWTSKNVPITNKWSTKLRAPTHVCAIKEIIGNNNESVKIDDNYTEYVKSLNIHTSHEILLA